LKGFDLSKLQVKKKDIRREVYGNKIVFIGEREKLIFSISKYEIVINLGTSDGIELLEFC